MTQVILYTQGGCKKSDKAKQLLSNRKVSYSEMDVSCNVFMKREMMERTGGKVTTPQIFINGKYIGGLEDLMAHSVINESSQAA